LHPGRVRVPLSSLAQLTREFVRQITLRLRHPRQFSDGLWGRLQPAAVLQHAGAATVKWSAGGLRGRRSPWGRPTLAFLLLSVCASAQWRPSGAVLDEVALKDLATTGSVLMIAAHPDDENTALLAYLARGLHMRTGYLSITRGEGGQNLLGPEQGDALGLIRTEELLDARRIDGAEQFFTRAIDFGFTKTADEALNRWGRERTLSDIVWVIRRFRPDVIILRFTGTPRDGHGQHQASAILGKEAFSAAADPHRFPEQFQYGVEPWQTKRLMWNMFGFTKEQQQENEKTPGRITVDVGAYDPLIGYSYAELAAMSRSEHKSQGMGVGQRKGSVKESLVTIAGDRATKDIFDDIDTTWNRVPGGAPVGQAIAAALRAFLPDAPEKSVPELLEGKKALARLKGPIVERKRRDLDSAIALCAGLYADAAADEFAMPPGSKVQVTTSVIDRGSLEFALDDARLSGHDGITGTGTPTKPVHGPLATNVPAQETFAESIAGDAPWSQPYWLVEPKQGDSYTVKSQKLIGLPENPPLATATFTLTIDGEQITLERPVIYRWVDHLRGQLTRPISIVPPIAIRLSDPALIFPDAETKRTTVELESVAAGSGSVALQALDGWRVQPASSTYQLRTKGEELPQSFTITPPAESNISKAVVSAHFGNRTVDVATELIDYPHIPPQYLFPPASVKLVRADIRNLARNVGYIMGAGDEMPEALRQIGSRVTLLTADDLARGDLSQYDAIVTGVRAYNTRPDLRASIDRLLEYVHAGGTLIVQYNTLDFFTSDSTADRLGPWPITISHDRVVDETAPIVFQHPDSPLLHAPNQITEADFSGWVQERGLYFASKWDSQYQSLFETHDPGEKPMLGGTLYARYGRGVYIFTALSWFRQLPAGVPGAFRMFANLLSAGKTMR